ncbi:hypothetical protein [Fictibacillus barbaricus]|uniref:Uncharacterized protein n=1 Tax=Fictibacillus barbaricus TaxID=182136 RepID=A0ABS2ZL06_9BACL|nr:hypothetical protein [Fictibacillus barbaricus]MBN3547978.1 hypothetical protein [Fictibacillus barbaricus]GGB53024.1 hypothetical protein GCM10007199_18630 [Fictibacillus barbaricus]
MGNKEVKHVEIPLRIWVAKDGDGTRIELGCLNQFRSSITEKQHKSLYNRLKNILEENKKWVDGDGI